MKEAKGVLFKLPLPSGAGLIRKGRQKILSFGAGRGKDLLVRIVEQDFVEVLFWGHSR